MTLETSATEGASSRWMIVALVALVAEFLHHRMAAEGNVGLGVAALVDHHQAPAAESLSGLAQRAGHLAIGLAGQ